MSRKPEENPPPENRDSISQEKTISGAADQSHFAAKNHFTLWAVCGFLLLAVGLVFGQTVRHDFINFDDDDYVYENPQVARGLTAQGIAWAFAHKHAGNWHPLTWLSHMLDCQIYGLAPWGHHLTNVLLHAGTVILLFLVLHKMTGHLWPSAFTAAVFAIHPLRAESVAWVAERKDVLSGLFFMLTLWAYAGYVRHPFSLARYLAVMVFFALGLMAKPMLVTLPFVLLLLDYWPLGRMKRGAANNQNQQSFSTTLSLAIEKVPLLVLAAASCAATIWAQSGGIATNEPIPFSLRIGNAVVSYIAYVGQFFYPTGLALLYPYPQSGLPAWKILGSLLVLVAICIGVVALRRRHPYLFTGWLWYIVMLLPVIGLIQVGVQAMADRYTHLPQIGLCIALAWGAAELCRFWPYRRWACGAASALVLVVLMGCAWRQTSFWRDSKTLWTRTLACTSQNYVAHNNLGNALGNEGRLQESMEQYLEVLYLKPDNVGAHNNLGVVLAQMGQTRKAIEHYRQALLLKPDYVEARYNLANALLQTGQFPEAIEHYREALLQKPDYPEAHYNLGNALLQTGQSREAIEHYRQAILLKPDYIDAHYNMGNALLQTGRPKQAIEYYRQALRLNLHYIEAYNNLAVALVQSGRPQEAIKCCRQALALSPNYAEAYYNLALAYANMNQSSEALAAAQKALELARSQGQTDRVKQIADWLNAYQGQRKNK